MAYNSAALTCMAQAAGPVGMKIWVYDTVDAHATVDAADYITDAKERGMEKGDLVYVRVWTTAIPAATSEKQTAAGTANILSTMGTHIVLGISTAGAGNLTNVTVLTMTDSD
jgi:hypothetical protein